MRSILARIVLFANTTWYLYNFRSSLARALRARGDEVVLLSPADRYAAALREEDLRWEAFEFDRRGLNPVIEASVIVRLIARYRGLQPDLVHHFTVKPVLYGSLAAILAGRPAVVNSIPGMGYLALARDLKSRMLRLVTRALYRGFLPRGRTKVIFQNTSDRDRFLEAGLVLQASTVVIPGSGVDLHRFRVTPEPEGEPVVLMASRMLWDKGAGELVEASRMLRSRGLKARVILAGQPDAGNPNSISNGQLRDWHAEGFVEWLGHQDNMPELYARAHLVVLPTSYGEGLPRSLVEAAACGRAIVASDVPGCREAVADGISGILVKPHDTEGLANAIEGLLRDPARRASMGRRGRERAEREFSDEQIVSQTLAVYDELLPRRSHDV
jgi:glycosyltransferase involved in cell wall biosynthesis